MKYFTFHVNDSGAVEYIDYKTINTKEIAICTMYDDRQFNSLNDILHSTHDFIISEKVLNILKNLKLIPHKIIDAKLLRKERILFLKLNRTYKYYNLSFLKDINSHCYEWINFEKGEIFALNSRKEKIKIHSHQETLNFIEINKSDSSEKYSFKTTKVVFGANFDPEIDFFTIPFYSWGDYVSERFKNLLLKENITDVDFAEDKERIGKVWKPHFPEVEFDL